MNKNKLARLSALADLLDDDDEPTRNADKFPFGGKVAIRSVTHYYTGEVIDVRAGFVILASAAWIASTGRWSAFLADGTPDEVEPCPDQLAVSLGAIVDVAPWTHALPRSVK